ncbi:hypothetical protein E143388_08165 [Rhodococcus opacus]|nr:hypothetical protein E143388_08165 [Rhodococcus opacus]
MALSASALTFISKDVRFAVDHQGGRQTRQLVLARPQQ